MIYIAKPETYLKYIAKPDTWFKEGTEAKLLCADICGTGNSGLFEGIRICQNPESEAKPLGLEYLDEEICGYFEFEMIG